MVSQQCLQRFIYSDRTIVYSSWVIAMYDTIIIGAGPAGLTAGIFAVRRDLNILVLGDPGDPPTVTEATIVDDWIGTPNIKGTELMQRFLNHAKDVKVPIKDDKILEISKSSGGFVLKGEKESYEAESIIFATGALHRELNIPGEKEFAGRGVSYCASCDGLLFKGKKVAVIGGGDTAATYALLLDQIGADTMLVHRRDQLRAVESFQEQIKNSNVKVMWNTVLKEIKGDKFVKSIIIENVKTNKKHEIPMDGVFIAVGSVPMSELGKNIGLKIDEAGYIMVDKEGKTSVPGVFAAGDCANNPTKRIITACADGSKAAEAAYMYIQEKRLLGKKQ